MNRLLSHSNSARLVSRQWNAVVSARTPSFAAAAAAAATSNGVLLHTDGAHRPGRFCSTSTFSDDNDNNNNNNNATGQQQQQQKHQSTAPPPKTSLSSMRTNILTSALLEVHQHGWTDDALAAAAMSCKQSSSASMSVVGMISVDDLIAFCMDDMNRQLKQDLLIQQNSGDSSDTSRTRNSIVEDALKMRLEYLIPYLQSGRWHEGMALGIRGPSNAMQTRQQLQAMVDIIVTHSTSSSSSSPNNNNLQLGTPEKMALGAVYIATELHLLTDSSEGYQDTWAFLACRMDDWRRVSSFASSSSSPTSGVVGSSSSAGLPAAADALFVASSVASSLFGGAVSLVMNNPKQVAGASSSSSSAAVGGLFGLPHEVLAALFSNQQPTAMRDDTASAKKTQHQDGTHPNHYDAPKRSS